MNSIFSTVTVSMFVVGMSLFAPGTVRAQFIGDPSAAIAGPSLSIFADSNDPLTLSNVAPISNPGGASPVAPSGIGGFDINSLIANTSFTGTPAGLGAPGSPYGNFSPYSNFAPFSGSYYNNPYSYYGGGFGGFPGGDTNYTIRYNNYLKSVNYANELYAYQYTMYLRVVTALNQQRQAALYSGAFGFNPYGYGFGGSPYGFGGSPYGFGSPYGYRVRYF